GGDIVVARQAREERTDLGICSRIQHDGVIDIVARLSPWIEHHLFPSVVWMKGCGDARDGVIEQHRANAGLNAKREVVAVFEEGLVLPDRLALVVEDDPAADDPAGLDRWTGQGEGAR